MTLTRVFLSTVADDDPAAVDEVDVDVDAAANVDADADDAVMMDIRIGEAVG